MKRYMLFTGSRYYPNGGMLDFRKSFDSIEEAKKELKYVEDGSGREVEYEADWWHIVDKEEWKIVRLSE